MTIVEFLTARLDEREELAQAEADLAAKYFPTEEATLEYFWARHTKHRTSGGSGTSFASGAPSPTEVLADIAAKRRIVFECDWSGCAIDDLVESQGRVVLRLLAAVYADHPDYHEEWRP